MSKKPWGSYPSDLRDRRIWKSCRRCGSETTQRGGRGYCSDLCRFLVKLTEQPNGCWQWTGAISDTGYGSFSFGGRVGGAHRAAYQMFRGPIPRGLVLDHLCRNRGCVNPSHLEPVTQRENVIVRGFAPASIVVRTNRCKRGHEFTPENTYRRPDSGHRMCRACCAMRVKRRAS